MKHQQYHWMVIFKYTGTQWAMQTDLLISCSTLWLHLLFPFFFLFFFFLLFFSFFFLFFGFLHCTLVHTSEIIKQLCYFSIFSDVIQLASKMTYKWLYNSFSLLPSELPDYCYLTVVVHSLLIKAALYETILHSLWCVLLNSELHQINVGHVVAQLVEALRYKLEGCGFDSRWCQRNFTLTSLFWLHYGPGVDSASNGKG
jgi:hypothetical protein